ncbi:MAG: hypothetical protein RIT02_1631 [Planctomycetota bacterium]|jgi:hypothetical protein
MTVHRATGQRFLLSLVCCLPLTLMADEPPQLKSPQPQNWRRSRQIDFSAEDSPRLLRIPLDTDFWTHTRRGYPDAAVMDDREQLIPFLIRHSPGSAAGSTTFVWNPSTVELRPEPDDSLSILVKLEKQDPTPEYLQIQTPLQDFEQRIEVTDESTIPPTPLCDPALLFDYSRFMDVRRTEIALRKSSSRSLKIRIATATDDLESPFRELTRTQSGSGVTEQSETSLRIRRAFRIDRISFRSSRITTNSTLPESRTLNFVSIEEDAKLRSTIVEFTSDLRPITSLNLQTPSRNFSRTVSVQVPADDPKAGWIDVATGTLADLSTDTLSDRRLDLPTPELNTTRLRLLIRNLDSPPLQITGLTATGPQYEVVLLAEPGHRYRLLYDDELAERPQHDLAALNRALQLDTAAAVASLQPVTERKLQRIPQPKRGPHLLASPWVLGTMVTVSAALLAVSLYRAVIRLESVPEHSTTTKNSDSDHNTTRQSP